MKRRDFKKMIRYCCGEMAAECILTKYFVDDADAELLNKTVTELAELQEKVLSRSNVSFDKSPSAFSNRMEYKKARRAFMHKAFASLDKHFLEEANKLVKQLNSAIPQVHKDAIKQAVAKK